MIHLDVEQTKMILNCSSLEIDMSAQWGSLHADHRSDMRRFIAQKYGFSETPETLEKILDLKQVPQLKEGFVSISHSPRLGVIGFSNSHIGVDLESLDRIQERVVARVSHAREIEAAPSHASLWVAKEAAFKSLPRAFQPPLMSQIELGKWNSLTSQSETFELLHPHFPGTSAGKGIVIRSETHAFAIFLFPY